MNPATLRVEYGDRLTRLVPAPGQSDGVVVLVHGDCADGFTSAGLLLRRFPSARAIYTHPSDLLEALQAILNGPRPEHLILADLSPQKQDLDRLLDATGELARVARVVWIDHHAPQWPQEFEAAVRKTGVEVVLDRDQRESGASLVAAWTGETDPDLQRVAHLIRLRDAWIDPHNAEARAWTLAALRYGRSYVQRLVSGKLKGLEEDGHRFVEEQEKRIQDLLDSVRAHSPAVRYVWGEDDISDVGDRLFRADPRAVLLLRFGPSGRVSIRSRPGRPVAAPLAQRFGGGGHGNAAGFTLRMGAARRLLLRLRRTADSAVRGALDAADSVAS